VGVRASCSCFSRDPVRWSRKDENHLALLQLASGLIAFKKAHTARLATLYPDRSLSTGASRRSE
jgi:hypothetical protein